MSRKRKAANGRGVAPQDSQARVVPAASRSHAAPAPAGRAVKHTGTRWWIVASVLVGLVLIAGVIGWQVRAHAQQTSAEQARPAYHIGGVASCRAQPAFTTKLGYSQKAAFSSRERTEKGLVLYEPDAQGNPTKIYKDPSWSSAGFLLPPVIDRDGNAYVAPVPSINVLYNPVDKANMLYRIDGQTGVMAPYLVLPAATTPSKDNPYGILGMTYDCDTNSLYVSSVFGSDRTTSVGRVFRVDLANKRIVARLDDIDAFGVVVYNTTHGKRLLFGMARTALVRSVALDQDGNFTSNVRDEFSLAGMGVHGDERARRLQTDAQNNLIVRTMQFEFNLAAPTDTLQTAFQYMYDATRDTWQLMRATPLS